MEFVVLFLMCCRLGLGGKGLVDCVLFIDEFNFVLFGIVMCFLKNLLDFVNKSRVYLY